MKFGSIRQFKYPKEFRIAAPKVPALLEVLARMVDLLHHTPPEIERSSRKEEDLLDLLADIGTVIWRLQRRVTTTVEVTEDIRRISRDLESAWDAMRQGSIEIKDHTGEKYDGGMALRVIAFQATPDLSREKVTETIKPTIYFRDKIIQMGQVIVGVPETDTASKPPHEKNIEWEV